MDMDNSNDFDPPLHVGISKKYDTPIQDRCFALRSCAIIYTRQRWPEII